MKENAKPGGGNQPAGSDRIRGAAEVAAEGALRDYFEASLDEASRSEEPVGFEEVAAYVDGTLEEIDREIFEARLESDSALQAEVADLIAMREAMSRPVAAAAAASASSATPFRSRARTKSMIWMLGALAAAAGVAGVLIWLGPSVLHRASGSRDLVAQSGTSSPGGPSTPPTPSPPSASRLVLQDSGGVAFLFDGARTWHIRTTSPIPDSLQQDAIAALTAGTLPSTRLPRELRSSGPLTLMSESPARSKFGVIAPVATLVREARPTFRWQSHPRARAYTVAIFTDQLEPVTASGKLTGTTWTPDVDLKSDTTYQWQVTALTPDGNEPAPAPPQPEARFRILSGAQRLALDQQLAEAGSSNLLRGLVLTRAGVLDEAERALETLSAANPTSGRARELLASVRTLRGLPPVDHQKSDR